MFLQVKYGLITLIKQEADLCDNLPKIDLSCPLKKGVLTLKKEVDLPKQIVSSILHSRSPLHQQATNNMFSHPESTLFLLM